MKSLKTRKNTFFGNSTEIPCIKSNPIVNPNCTILYICRLTRFRLYLIVYVLTEEYRIKSISTFKMSIYIDIDTDIVLYIHLSLYWSLPINTYIQDRIKPNHHVSCKFKHNL